MEFLQNIDPSTVILLGLGCTCLCGVIFVLGVFINIIEILVNIFEMFFGVISGLLGGILGVGDPGCGCVFLIFGCGGCGLLTWTVLNVLQTCGTAEQVNFCRLFGY